MTPAAANNQADDESASDRLQGLIAEDALTIETVSSLAGDRPLTDAETAWLDGFRKNRGRLFFSDLLYAITHQYFPPEAAEPLWDAILKHKLALSSILMRNVRISVATLDYLSNITPNMVAMTLIGEHHMAEIVGSSIQDGLTGLFNHSYFHRQIELEVRRYVRYGAALSLAFIDIDDFKQVNDRFGHQEGDRVLAAMGRALVCAARDTDICCRYGGEELAVILPMTGLDNAEVIARRMKTDLAQRLPGAAGLVTVSIGVSSCSTRTRTSPSLVKAADTALYRAKRLGKNRVELDLDEGDSTSDDGGGIKVLRNG